LEEQGTIVDISFLHPFVHDAIEMKSLPISSMIFSFNLCLKTVRTSCFRRSIGNLTKRDSANHDDEQQQVQLTNSEEHFGKAKDNIIHTLDQVEKKVLYVAEQMIHDEVDILFGKDHGSRRRAAIKKTAFDSGRGASSSEEQQQQQPQKSLFPNNRPPSKFFYRTMPETKPFSKNKMTVDVKATTNIPLEPKVLPHSPFLDIMESYAENCHAQFGY
jgi:hypothetical protein